MIDPLLLEKRGRAIVFAFVVSSAIAVFLLLIRRLFSEDTKYTFLVWNLFLAWVPLFFAWASYRQMGRPQKSRWLLFGCLCGWFFFFPNAPYIVTDLVHLKTRAPIPRWFDMIMITSFAWTGLFLGFCSLFLMHARVRQRLGTTLGWAFVGIMLGLASFGIYLGRFLRWNSWDILLTPLAILKDAARIADLDTQLHMAAFSLTFFVFSISIYLMLHAVSHLHAPESGPVLARAAD